MTASVPSSALTFLHALLRDESPGEIPTDAAAHLLALVTAHGLDARLDEAVRDGRARVPDAQRPGLRERMRTRTAKALHALHIRDQAVGLLQAAGVPVVVLKGAAFADWLYPRPELRAFEDVDLLVPRSSWRMALAVLVAGGASAGRRSGSGPHVRSVQVPGGLVVDLHGRFADAPGRAGLDGEPVFDRALPTAHGGPQVPTLSLGDHLLHVAEHAARSKWVRLGWLTDVHLLREHLDRAGLALDEVRALADRVGRRRMLELALLLEARAYGRPHDDVPDLADLVATCESNQLAPNAVDAHGFDAAWFARLVDDPDEIPGAHRDRWRRGMRRRILRLVGQ
ncbi:MAG: nucleotidyltransferase family protein [Planctomycetota bacterium]